MNQNKTKTKILRAINRQQRLILIIGLILTTYGTLRFLLVDPIAGYNLKTLLPTISNGAEFIVIGLGLLIGWYLTHKNKSEIVKMEEEEITKRMRENRPSIGEGDSIERVGTAYNTSYLQLRVFAVN